VRLDKKEILYDILVEFGVPIELVRLIQMCLNETHFEACIGKDLFDYFPIQKWSKTR
jgi:hypothetical protein